MGWKAYPQGHTPWEISIGIMPYEFDKIPFNVVGKYHLKSDFGFRLGIGGRYFRDINRVYELVPRKDIIGINFTYTELDYRYDLERKELNLSGFTGIQYQFSLKKFNIFVLSDFVYSYTSLSVANREMLDLISEGTWEAKGNHIGRKITGISKTHRFMSRKGIGVSFELLNDLLISLESTVSYSLLNYSGRDEYVRIWNYPQFPIEPNDDDGIYRVSYNRTGKQFGMNLINMLGISYRF